MKVDVVKKYLEEINSNIDNLLNIKYVEKGIYKTTCLKNKKHIAYYNPVKKEISCSTCRYEMNLLELSSDVVGVSTEEMLLSILIKKMKKNKRELTDLLTLVEEVNKDKEVYYAANKEAFEIYKIELEKSDIAKDYIFNKRKISKDIVNKFSIGYAPKGNIILKKLSKKYGNEKLHEIGLLGYNESKNKYFDMFQNRVMFPVFNCKNDIIAFGGRALGDASPKYLNTATTRVFQKSHELYGLNTLEKNKKYDYILCTEGYMDVVALNVHGITNCVANLGTAFTEHHLRVLSKYTKKIILMLDGDSAGVNAMKRVLCKIGNVYTTVLPDNLDPDEYLKIYSKEDLLKYIENNHKNWEESMCDLLLKKEDNEDENKNIFETLINLKEY